MLKASLRSLLGHKVRLALTVVSVVAGVAFVAGSFVLTDSLNRTFESLFSATTENVDIVVRGAEGEAGLQQQPTRQPLPLALGNRMAAVNGVDRVLADLQGVAVVVGADGTAVRNGGAPTLAFAAYPDDPVLEAVEGRFPQAAGEVGIDPAALDKGGLSVGDTTTVVVAGQPRQVTIVGALALKGGGSLAGATTTFFDPATARAYFAPDGTVPSFSVLTDDAAAASVMERLRAVVPDGTDIATGQEVADEQTAAVKDALGFFSTFLLVFAAVALLVGSFVIVNTFSMLVAQRTRELALLRALGASRRQVTVSLLAEAFVVGLVSSVLGILAGVGLAAGLKALLRELLGLATDASLPVAPRTVAWGFAVGVGVTMLAAWFPARRARRIPPMAALRDDVALPERGLAVRLIAGVALLVLSAVAFVAGELAEGTASVALVGAGALAAFLGVATLVPVLARPALAVLGVVTRPFRTPGRLARDNAARNPRRTAATASALMIGLALVGAVSVLAGSAKAATADIVRSTVKAPLLLSAGSFSMFPVELAGRAAHVEGVAKAAALAYTPARVDGEQVYATGVSGQAVEASLDLTVVSGDLAGLDRDAVAVDESTAAENGWTAGDTVTLSLGTIRERQVPIVAVYKDNAAVDSWLVSRTLYDEGTPVFQRADALVFLTLEEGADEAAVRERLAALVKPFAIVSVQNRDDFVSAQARTVDQSLAVVYALLLLSVVVAVIGIVNTLALSVFERTREIGLLRAVGLSRRQLRRTVRLESVLVSVYGAVLGVVVGLGLGVVLQRMLADQGLDVLVVPWTQFGAFVVAAAAVGVLAALWPAWRAGRMDVLQAIATE